MTTKLITCCPICNKETTVKGKNGFTLCKLHSWVKGFKTISIKR